MGKVINIKEQTKESDILPYLKSLDKKRADKVMENYRRKLKIKNKTA